DAIQLPAAEEEAATCQRQLIGKIKRERQRTIVPGTSSFQPKVGRVLRYAFAARAGNPGAFIQRLGPNKVRPEADTSAECAAERRLQRVVARSGAEGHILDGAVVLRKRPYDLRRRDTDLLVQVVLAR